MGNRDVPATSRPARATRAAGSEHSRSIWSRMSPQSTKSGSRDKGMVADSVDGVSGRSEKVSGAPGRSSGANLTRRQVEVRVDRCIALPHLETLVSGSKRCGLHYRRHR